MAYLFQRVPEAAAPRGDLDEALAFHKLTRTKMTAELIRWLPSIRLESPEAYKAFTTDPPQIAPYIKKYDFVFSTGMTTDYSKRRGWTHWMAIREFLQNSLDVEEHVFGYEGISVKVWHDLLGVHVADRGTGITLEAFKLGASDKACHERGYFGEGLKVALSHLAGEGIPVYVINRQGQVFKSCVSPGTNLVVVVLGRAAIPPAYGTEVIIFGAKLSPDLLVSTLWQEWMKNHPEASILSTKWFGTTPCPEPKPNTIIQAPAGEIDLLWVRDIFVNRISNLTGKKAIFGYNLWWVPLEPNRIAVSSLPDFYKNAGKAYTPEAARTLLDKIIVFKEGHAEIPTGTFEVDCINWWGLSDDVYTAVAQWIEAHGLGVTTDKRALDWIKYMGVKPLIVPRSMEDLFIKAPAAEDKVVERSIERLKLAETSAIPEEVLTMRELINLGIAKAIFISVTRDTLWDKKMPDIIVSKTIGEATGKQVGDKIYVARSKLYSLSEAFGTIFHEYSHWYGNEVYGEAQDLSEAFQKSLTEVGGAVAVALTNWRLQQVLKRIQLGCWRATPSIWNEETNRYVTKTLLFDTIIELLHKTANVEPHWAARWTPLYEEIETKAPIVIGVNIPEETKILPESFRLLDKNVLDIIPIDIPPAKPLYLDKIKDEAARIGEVIQRGIILIYDPWEDIYIVHERKGL